MTRSSDIITLSLGVAALVTLVYAKDRSTPTPGVRTAIELIGHKAQVSLTSQRYMSLSRALVSANEWAAP